ncbi:unnamed protein product [Boreogadus saida]
MPAVPGRGPPGTRRGDWSRARGGAGNKGRATACFPAPWAGPNPHETLTSPPCLAEDVENTLGVVLVVLVVLEQQVSNLNRGGWGGVVRGSSRYLVKREMLDSGAGVRGKRGTATDLQSEGRWTGTKALFRQSALRGVSCDGWSRPPQTHPEQVCLALTSAGEHGEPRPNGRRTGPIGFSQPENQEKDGESGVTDPPSSTTVLCVML